MRSINSTFGNLDDLFLFCSVVKAGSLSKASDELNLPAATVSRRLQALESRLSTKLLQPHKRYLVPTAEGSALFQEIVEDISRLDRTMAEQQFDARTYSGTIRLNVPRAFYYDVARDVLRELRRKFPKIHIQVFTNQLTEQTQEDTKSDILMVFDLTGFEDYVALPLYRTKRGIFARYDFFKKGEPKKLEDLAKYPWIHNYTSSTLLFYAEEKLIDVLDITPHYVVNDIHAQADEIRAGMGIGFLPIAKAARHPELRRIFPEINGKIKQAYLVYRKTAYTPKKIVETVKALEKGAQDWFSKMNDWEFEKTVRMYSER